MYFQKEIEHMLYIFGKQSQKKGQGPQKSTFLVKTKVVPIAILCRMHRVSNSGDLFVDDFVDISIFMIWRSLGVVWPRFG